jgi:hypothetical protein
MIKGLIAAAAALVAMPAQAADVDPLTFGAVSDSFTRIGPPSDQNIFFSGGILRAWLLTFNRARLPAFDTSADFTLNNVTPALGSGGGVDNITLSYSTALDRMTVFGAAAGEDIDQNANDVFFTIDNVFRGTATVGQIRFSSSQSAGGFWQSNYQFAAVPEPASWSMMIGGFGLAGAAVGRRRVNLAFA